MHVLKPHDVVIALKIGRNEQDSRFHREGDYRGPYRSNSVGDLSEDLLRGKSDVSRSIHRLIKLGLIAERRIRPEDPAVSNRKQYALNRQGMADFLVYGIRHVFAPDKVGYGRGMPTGWSCELLKSPMNPPDVPMVWPDSGGSLQGELIEPLYPQCPAVAKKDKGLYELLALIDILRTGKPRELEYAKKLIQLKVQSLY